jgi:TLC ATP/ADP transporter
LEDSPTAKYLLYPPMSAAAAINRGGKRNASSMSTDSFLQAKIQEYLLSNDRKSRINMIRIVWGSCMLSIISFIIGAVLLTTGSEAFSSQGRLSSPTRGIWTQSMLHPATVRQIAPLRIKNGLRMSDAAISDAGDDGASKTPSGFWNKVKSIVPPANERQKLIPLAVMFFCILFSYTILRDTKDVLMITAPKSGAEVIPFIKTYVNLPVAIVRAKVGVASDRSRLLYSLFTCHLQGLHWFVQQNV